MPVVETAIPQVEVDALTVRQAPLFATTNALRSWNRAPEFSDSGLWSDLGGYITDPNFPTTALRDGHAIITARPTSVNGMATFYLLFDLTPGGLTGLTGSIQNVVDLFALLNHNLSIIAPSGTTIDFQISPGDQQDFGDVQTVATIGNAFVQDWKIIGFNLATLNGSYRRWTQFRYARFRFTAQGGNFNSIIPQIGEVIIGTRRQMMHRPMVNNPIGEVLSDVAVFGGETGMETEYVLAEGFAEPSLSFHLARAAASPLGVDEIALAQSIWNDTNQGTRSFLFVDDPFPDTAPPGALHPRGLFVKFRNKKFAVNMNAWGDGIWPVSLREQPPSRAGTEVRYPWDT